MADRRRTRAPGQTQPGAHSRALAAQLLAECLGGQPLGELLERRLSAADDAPFVRELAYGTARHYYRLQHIVRGRLQRPIKRRDLDLECLLLTGVYQLACLDVPPRACVHASAEAARLLGKAWAVGLVNAVLRRLLQDPGLRGLPDDPALPEPARHDHPQWLIDALRAEWPERWQAIIAADNARPPMTLRVNRAQLPREAYLKELAHAGIGASPGSLTPESIYLENPQSVESLPGFDQGRVSVQDEGAQLAAHLLAAEPGDRVLDACAAPGGKTGHLLERTPELTLVAVDPVPRRLARVRANLERIGADARLITADARATATWWDGEAFDRILIDAPCTATGILRRQPDVRLLRRREDVAKLAAVQRQLLTALFPLLRPGGRLVYATCSLLDEENAGVVDAFLAEAPAAGACSPAADWGVARGRAGRVLPPSIAAHDGFYYACLSAQARG